MPDTITQAVYKMNVSGKETVDEASRSIDGLSVSEEKLTKATRASEQGFERLIAKLDPLVRAQQQYQRTIEQVGKYEAAGIGTEAERANVIDLAARRLQVQTAALGQNKNATESATRSIGLQRYELINLSRQIQDVGVSLVSGQSPFLVLVQQGTQIADIFSNSEATVGGFFRQMLSGVASVLTPARIATGAIGVIGGAALTAATQWSQAQRQIDLALTGSGRASGASASDINSLARSGSSLSGLSVSEARALATALAETGRVGVSQIAPIISLGHDIATVYGIDAAQAAKKLAAAFADPAKGADDLNQRLGFLDAATQRLIADLSAQGRVVEAQNLLYQSASRSLDGVQRNVSTLTRFWNVLGNAASDAWDWVGQFASRSTGIGYVEGLTDRIGRLTKEVDTFNQALAITPPDGQTLIRERLAAVQKDLDAATAAWQKYQKSIEEAQARRDSFEQGAAVRRLLPELDQLDKINNDYLRLSLTLSSVNRTGGEQSPVLKAMGISFEQLARSVAAAKGQVDGFKSANERALAGVQLDISAIGKRSPSALGDVAYKRSLLNSGSNGPDATAIADAQRTLAVKQSQQQITDAQRDQLLVAKQRVDAQALEVSILGRSTVEQERARAILQAKQQLEQEALRIYGNRDAYDKRHLASLTAQIDREAELKRFLVEQQTSRDLNFERAQIGRSSDEQSVASRLRGIYGDDYESQLNGSLATQTRFNQQLQMTHDVGLEAFKGLTTGAKSFGDVAQTAISRFADKLSELVYNQGFNALFGGGQGGAIAGFGGAARGGLFGGAIIPGILHAGGLGRDAPSSGRFVHPAYFENAPRFHSGKAPWGPGEMGAIIKPEEEVLTTQDPRHRWNGGTAQRPQTQTVVQNNYTINAPGASAEAMAAALSEIRRLNRQVLAMPETLAAAQRRRPDLR